MKYVIMDIRLKFKNLFSKYFLFLLLFAHVMLTSSFGYDSAASCSPGQMKMSRRGRAQLLATIPCNLNEQAYCNLPGASYPWHAVRRFVHENQGLMKRMYGDVRHISILRTEIQNNEINVNDVEAAADRYSRDGSRHSKYLHGEYNNIRNNDVLMEPHFRPVSTTTTTTTSTTTTPKSTSSPATTTAKPKKVHQQNLDDVEFGPDDGDDDENLQDNSVYEAISEKPFGTSTGSDTDNIKLVKSPNLGLANLTETATISTTLRIVQQLIKADTIEVTEKSDIVDSYEVSEESEEKLYNKPTDDLRTTIPLKERPTDQKNLNNTPTEASMKVTNSAADKNKKPIMMDGQLFQDTVQKEPTLVNNVRGVNACPVKEEVVAPFWANNTRGEVLALLNLYPFEQYVHWEKCTNEHKQMYCRDGCRCEQQYRLHRLLAYDPHNECRGIFSDWFRFPSCCICKCYDIPLEFRATSRSPRSDSEFRHPIDLAESEVKKAIYEHATEEWYRPKEDTDFE